MATNKKPAAGNEPVNQAEQAENQNATPTQEEAATEAKETPVKKSAPVKRGPAVAKVSERRANQKAAMEAEDPEEKIESAINRTEQFLYDNGKTLLTVLVLLVGVVMLFLGYKYLYQTSRYEKAGSAMFVAEQQFAADSFSLALYGDGNNYGFLDIIDKYGSTPQGNIANHYAGICYLKMGELDNAAEYLSKYKATKGAPNELVNAQNLGLQGDVFVQQGDFAKAAEKYRQAVDVSTNSLTAPYYLKKLGLVYDKLGRTAEAMDAYQRILDEYASSAEGRDIEKYIGADEQK